ncbi:MAG: HD-GYP domain-containing protein, partial [Oscillospiraceae bacterium]
QAKRISDMQHNIILTMADIVESRDENTGGHIRRTAEYVRIIAEKLRENGQYSDILTDEYIEDMIVAAPLHDMGKIHVSDNILNKPGRLDKEEYAIMQTHTTAGRDMLENATHTLGSFSYLNMAVQMAAYHHEKWNGKGYPEGISGMDIPLCARIMAVADVFDALISKRCYKEAMPLEKAYGIIREESGAAFDPVVTDAFFASSKEIERAVKSFDQQLYQDK